MLNSIFKKILYKFISFDDFLNYAEQKRIQTSLSQICIGMNSVIYNDAVIENLKKDKNSILIGENTHIRGELVIWPYAQILSIGNNSFVGRGSVIRAGEKILIGNNVLISHNVTIIDSDSHEINHIERADSFLNMIKLGHPQNPGNVVTSPIIIQDHVWISYGVAVLKGVTIGKGAIIGANSVVTKNVEPWTVVAGNPAKVIKTSN